MRWFITGMCKLESTKSSKHCYKTDSLLKHWGSLLPSTGWRNLHTSNSPKTNDTLNYNYSHHLYTQSLQSLGVTDVFNGSANLTGFSTKNLFVSSFIHKSFVEVTEEGTTASAVTTGILVALSFTPRTLFHCNRPFIFLITENENKNLLFMGAYMGFTT